MTIYKCKYCGKEYKTQKGLEKHHCIQMDRYNEVNDVTQYVFTIVNTYYNLCNLPTDKEERIFAIINSKFFTMIKDLEKWAIETIPVNFIEYVKFLKANLVPFNKWTLPHTYHCFLYKYLKEESATLAIMRGEKYLKDNNISLDNISSNRLYLAIKYGQLSKKFLDYMNFNPKKMLDDSQWTEIKSFFVDEYFIK